MSVLAAIENVFKRIGVAIGDVVTYLPKLQAKFSKAVRDAKDDTAEVVQTGKPFVAAVAQASAAIAAAAADKGLKWTEDAEAVQKVEAAFKLWPPFWAAIEKEGADISADVLDEHKPIVITGEHAADVQAPPADQVE